VIVDERIIKFFEGVLSKTREGRIPWEPTAQESNFIAPIGGEFTLSISAQWITRPLSASLEKYTLALRDMHGTIATLTDGEEGMRPGAMRELYETARWQAVHGGEKINKALEVLQSL
jgi:hypothetical protein